MPLKISLRAGSPHEVPADLVVVGVWALSASTSTDSSASGKKRVASPTSSSSAVSLGPLESLDRALGGGLAKLVAKEEFTGKRDQQLSVPTMGRLPADRIILVGLGDKATFGPREQRSFSAKAARSANHDKATTLALGLPDGFEPSFRALGEGLELGAYRFIKYYTGDRKPKATIANGHARDRRERRIYQGVRARTRQGLRARTRQGGPSPDPVRRPISPRSPSASRSPPR